MLGTHSYQYSVATCLIVHISLLPLTSTLTPRPNLSLAEEKEFIHKKALLKSYRKLLKKEGFGPSLSTAQESGPGGMNLVPEGPLGEVSGGKRRLPPEVEKIGTEDEGLERCDTGPGGGELRKRTRMEAEESDGDSGGPPAAYRGDGGSPPQPGPARPRKGLKGTKAKPDPFARARQHALAKKEEAEEEALRREAKSRALKKSAKVRRERHVLLSKTTRRGQPIMKTRIHGILDRLEREGRT